MRAPHKAGSLTTQLLTCRNPHPMPLLTVKSRDEIIKCSSSCAVLAGQLPDALQYSASMPPTCKIAMAIYRQHAHYLSIDGTTHEHVT
jgi:hypothetical protein